MSQRIYTVSMLLDDYVIDFKLRGCKSMRSVQCDLKRLRAYFGKMALKQISTRILKQYQMARRKDGMANGTINRELAVFRAAFRVAIENEAISTMPQFPRRLPKGKPRDGYFEAEHYEAIRFHLPDWAQDVLDFAYHGAGWRLSEILGLTWSEVDFDSGEVRLDPRRSKNSEGRLPLPIGDRIAEVLARRAKTRVFRSSLVFHRGDGKMVGRGSWWRAWSPARNLAGLPEKKFHDTRRSMTRDLIRSGIPRDIAKGVTGHKSDQVFSDYNVTTLEDVQNAMAMVREYRERRQAERSAIPLFKKISGEKENA